MTQLTPHAKQALETLAMKHIAYVTNLELIREELRQELENRVSGLRAERDVALRLADEAGVPRTRLGKAIGTSNYKTVQDILQATESMVHTETSPDVSVDSKWSIVRQADGTFVLSINNMGVGSVTGSAVVSISDGDIEYVTGDEFVVPQIYRNGHADAVVNSAS